MSIVICEECSRKIDLDEEESYLKDLKVCKECWEEQ